MTGNTPMEPVCLLIVLVPLLVVAIWAVANYNALIRLRNTVHESWAQIDTELKRRYDLIPNLVETVKGYAAHERQTLEMVIEARNRAVASTGSPGAQAKDENVLVGAMRQLFAVVENYPQLRANENFLKLQQELTNTEDRLQAARRFYNANVRDYNTRIAVVPTTLIAGMFNFKPEEYFEIEDVVQRQAPAVAL